MNYKISLISYLMSLHKDWKWGGGGGGGGDRWPGNGENKQHINPKRESEVLVDFVTGRG